MSRKPEVERHKQIWLSKESYEKLRKLKLDKKQSMVRILDNILKGDKYGL